MRLLPFSPALRSPHTAPGIAPTDALEARERGGIDHKLEYPLSSVTDNPACHPHERSPKRTHRVSRPGRGTGQALQPNGEVAGDHAEAAPCRIRPRLTAGEPLSPPNPRELESSPMPGAMSFCHQSLPSCPVLGAPAAGGGVAGGGVAGGVAGGGVAGGGTVGGGVAGGCGPGGVVAGGGVDAGGGGGGMSSGSQTGCPKFGLIATPPVGLLKK